MEPPNQRTLKSKEVQNSVGLTQGEWRHVKQDALDYCRQHLNSVAWGSQNEEDKIKHCIAFRSSIQFSEKFVRCEENYTIPWASWYLLSIAAKNKEAPQSNATQPPQPSTRQGSSPGESASGDLHASKSSAEDPVLRKATQSDFLRHSQSVSAPTRPSNQQVTTQQKSPLTRPSEFRGLPYDPTKKEGTQI